MRVSCVSNIVNPMKDLTAVYLHLTQCCANGAKSIINQRHTLWPFRFKTWLALHTSTTKVHLLQMMFAIWLHVFQHSSEIHRLSIFKSIKNKLNKVVDCSWAVLTNFCFWLYLFIFYHPFRVTSSRSLCILYFQMTAEASFSYMFNWSLYNTSI